MDKVKFVMVGQCARCGKKYTRKPPIDAVACVCQNPDATLVTLYPTLVLPDAVYAKFSLIAELTDISVEKLVNEFLSEGARQTLAELKSMPQIVVTTKRNERKKLRGIAVLRIT